MNALAKLYSTRRGSDLFRNLFYFFAFLVTELIKWRQWLNTTYQLKGIFHQTACKTLNWIHSTVRALAVNDTFRGKYLYKKALKPIPGHSSTYCLWHPVNAFLTLKYIHAQLCSTKPTTLLAFLKTGPTRAMLLVGPVWSLL